MRNAIKTLLLTATILAAGCTDAAWNRQWSYNTPHKITLYSGGQKVGEWTSTGKPMSIAESDGWMFTDQTTGRLVIVTGTVVLESEP